MIPANDKMPKKRQQPSGGSRKGRPNKTTSILKEAIILAAEEVGQDGEGYGGLTGYLRRVALEDVKAFSGLLGKVLPLQIVGDRENPLPVVAMSPEQFEQLAKSIARQV